MNTILLDAATSEDLRRTSLILLAGGLVGVPTETVYGLAADASQPSAVKKIFAAKGRPTDHPLILHVADIDAAHAVSSEWPDVAEVLGTTFWPGPITLLVRRAEQISTVVTGGRETVAVRVPDQPGLLEILDDMRRSGSVGIAAPSANKFGRVSPTTAQHVLEEFQGTIDAVLDAGACQVGVESTIVDCTTSPPRLLRPGGVSLEDLNAALDLADLPMVSELGAIPGDVKAPGMLPSHYAPQATVRLFDNFEEARSAAATVDATGGRSVLLEAPTDNAEYARQLFRLLREADATHPDVILAVLPSSLGLGRAVRDGLAKAAAAR